MAIRNDVLVTTAVLLFSTGTLAQTAVPNDFQAGQTARASEVNANFDALETAIDQNAADVDQNATDIEQNTNDIDQNKISIQQNTADIQIIQGMTGLSPEARQIQTGLDLTSGLRWLVTESYLERGLFPASNASAGAASMSEYSNRFVAGASVVDGVIEISFRGDAAEQIATQSVFLTPMDPGSGAVWFDCTGDGITDEFLAELDCAFSDPPVQPLYRIRQMVLSAFDLLEKSGAQQAISDYYDQNGVFPAENQQAGLAPPSDYQNKYVTDLTISSFGQITMTFGNDAFAVIRGTTIRWSPDNSLAVLRWACDSLTLDNKYLPFECRS